MNIYLAGGFYSGWQDKVKELAPQHTYFNPAKDADQRFAYRWTTQEIEAVKNCDIVFAYFEKDNPSGLGLAKEIGWATILNKPVIYIDEHPRLNAFLCACSQRVYSDFMEAVKYLTNN
jgi:nucleoside 2-deoxyribosyltransferase